MSDNILIVERDRDVGNTIKIMASAMDYQATSVCTVDAALTELSRKQFDVVLTSTLYVSSLRKISLPWLMKQVQPTINVVLTAAGEPVDINTFGNLDACLCKPFSVDDLEAVMRRLPQRYTAATQSAWLEAVVETMYPANFA